jgi:hypothetical protein
MEESKQLSQRAYPSLYGSNTILHPLEMLSIEAKVLQLTRNNILVHSTQEFRQAAHICKFSPSRVGIIYSVDIQIHEIDAQALLIESRDANRGLFQCGHGATICLA